MKLATAKRQHDALRASERTAAFCKGVTREEFMRNAEEQFDVQKAIENIGEALRRAEMAEPEVVKSIPDLPKIVDMRNRLIHGFDSVDYDVVWDTATTRLLSLRMHLEDLLAGAPPSEYEATP